MPHISAERTHVPQNPLRGSRSVAGHIGESNTRASGRVSIGSDTQRGAAPSPTVHGAVVTGPMITFVARVIADLPAI